MGSPYKFELELIEEALNAFKLECLNWRIHPIRMEGGGEQYWLVEQLSDWLGADNAVCRKFQHENEADTYVMRQAMERAMVVSGAIADRRDEEQANVRSEIK